MSVPTDPQTPFYRVLVITAAGSAVQASSTGIKNVPQNSLIYATAAGMYIGPSGVTSANGFLVPTATPIALPLVDEGQGGELVDLSKVYVTGTGEVRILYLVVG